VGGGKFRVDDGGRRRRTRRLKNGAPFRCCFGAILDEMTRFIAAITEICKIVFLYWGLDG